MSARGKLGRMWSDHSRSVVAGGAGFAFWLGSQFFWEGKWFDNLNGFGTMLLGIAILGYMDYRFVERAKPEDPPPSEKDPAK